MSTERPTRVRYLVVFMLCMATTCAYLTRVISAAVPKIQDENALSYDQMGAVVASGLTAVLVNGYETVIKYQDVALFGVRIPAMGWRNVFVLYSLAGIVWAIAFFLLYRDKAERHPWVNDAERELIRDGG